MSRNRETEENTHFLVVDGESDLFLKVTDVYKTIVAKSYGDQSEALSKISKGEDRQCMVLVDNKNELLGLLVYKTKPNSEYAANGVKDSLEIKSIRLLQDSDMNSRVFFKKLLRQAEALAKAQNCRSLHVTVSSKDDEMKRLLRDYDFRTRYEWSQRYLTGVTEYLMSKSLDTDHHDTTTASNNTSSSSSHSSSQKKKPISITLMKRYIHHIKSGRKTVEGRVATRMFADIRQGDWLRFFYHHDPNDDVVCEVLEANRYPTFREMLENEGTSQCIPGMDRVESGVRLYQNLPGYREKEAKFGVIAFKLKVIKK